MWPLIIVLIVLIIILLLVGGAENFVGYFRKGTSSSLAPCVKAHSQNADNYPWLNHIHGGVKKIMYEEPAGSGQWAEYTDKIWAIHCKVVDHDADLVEGHMRAFVNPETRFARLHFYFQDGTVMEPTRQFYELERAWFKNKIEK